MNVSSKVIAGSFALSAFVVAIFAGLAAGNPVGQIMWRAVIAMIVCYPVGLLAGLVCARVITMHVEQYSESNAHLDAANAPPNKNETDEEPIVV